MRRKCRVKSETEEERMKGKLRKFLAMVMVLVMACGLISTAGAVGTGVDLSNMSQSQKEVFCLVLGGHFPTTSGNYSVCGACGKVLGYVGTFGNGYGTSWDATANHSVYYVAVDTSVHQVFCGEVICGLHNGQTEPHTGTSCACNYYYASNGHTPYYQYIDGLTHWKYCSAGTNCTFHPMAQENCSGANCSCRTGTGTHTWVYQYIDGLTHWKYCSAGTGCTLHIMTQEPCSGNYCSCRSTGGAHSWVYQYIDGAVHWKYCSTGSGCTLHPIAQEACTGTGCACRLTASTTGLVVTPSGSLSNGDTYTPGSSQWVGVTAAVYDANGVDVTGNYTITYSWSGTVTAYATGSAFAYLDTSASAAYASCLVTATPASGTALTQTVTWYVTAGGAGGNVIYTARTGQNVQLNQTDFTDFWKEAYPYGTLTSVTFTGITPGYLYDGYNGSYYSSANVAAGTTCYLTPSAYQKGLNNLTYVPGATSTTATIQFTATGTTGTYSYTPATVSGVITIVYTAKDVPAIDYPAAATSSTLSSKDFVDVYKSVMGVSYALESGLSIEFLDVPTFGSFYVDRTTYYNGTMLTAANLSSYIFSCSTAASRSIEDITYVPGTLGTAESVRYACYYANQLQYVGTVTFGKKASGDVQVSTFVGTPVTFSYDDFAALEGTGTNAVTYLSFGTPESGTLYKNYANGTGTKVTAADTFYLGTAYGAYSLNNVTYVPTAVIPSVVKVPYSGYTVGGQMVSGILEINVSKKFADVTPGTCWAWKYIAQLSVKGIVDGDGTNFHPKKELDYGSALKLIMLAAGYDEQATKGYHWADGYLAKAYYDGLVATAPNSAQLATALNGTVTREKVAELACKALGLSPAVSVKAGITGPSDTTNGYVYALYNAGILTGANVGGQNYYYGSKNITREDVCKIICEIADYKAAN